MVTAIYSLANVHGAELWLLFWLVCLAAYIAACLMFRPNRAKAGVKTVFIGLMAAELIIDFVWAAIYYPNGSHINYGIGAIYGLFMWIPVLTAACIIVTFRNRRFYIRTHH